MGRLLAVLKNWLPLASSISLVFFAIYAAVQQVYRTGADDPQIQMAEDAATRLAHGAAQKDILPAQEVDLATSLAPYLIVYDSGGKVQAANASLHGQVPEIPQGVLEAARQKGENRITWQPEPGVRSAIVVVPVAVGTGGYVLAGRSLREVERREGNLTLALSIGLAFTLLLSLALVVALELATGRRSSG